MKYCTYCGSEMFDDAVLCVKCGCKVPETIKTVLEIEKDRTMEIVVKVWLILGCISQGWLLLPLLWCIPITVSVWNSLEKGMKIGTGMKICTLLLVNLIAGVCLLCMDDDI